MNNDNEEFLPVSTNYETTLDITAALSSIAPWFGGPVSSVLSGMSISRKMDRIRKVLLNVSEKIKNIESNASKKYVETEEFQELLEKTLLLTANEHNDEKRKAYANILANDIENPTMDTYEEKVRFLKTLEDMQVNHIHLIKALNIDPDPDPPNIGSIAQTLKKRLPNFSEERIKDLAEQLTDMKVVNLSNINTMITGRSAELLNSRITTFGQRLIKYIFS